MKQIRWFYHAVSVKIQICDAAQSVIACRSEKLAKSFALGLIFSPAIESIPVEDCLFLTISFGSYSSNVHLTPVKCSMISYNIGKMKQEKQEEISLNWQ